MCSSDLLRDGEPLRMGKRAGTFLTIEDLVDAVGVDAGRYEIGCAQHCGVSHYKMRGWLIAAPEDAYRGWLARAETDSRLRFDPADVTAHEGWDWETGR